MNPRRTSAGFLLLVALAFGAGTGQAGVKRDLAPGYRNRPDLDRVLDESGRLGLD